MPAVFSTPRVDLDMVFKALASEQRREILKLLSGHAREECGPACATDDPDEVCACEIAAHLGLAASTISHHMGLLRDAGLVSARKDGLWVHYALQREALDAAADALRGF